MKEELIIQQEEKINMLSNLLIENADGVNIIGNAGNIVSEEGSKMKHTFVDQIYVRQMEMKKDSLVVGAIHNHLHVWFLLTGNLTIATSKKVEEYIAPCYVVAQPGSKRVIYANEDSIFVNIHKNPSNTKDMKELEKDIVSLNKEQYNEYIKTQNNKI
tara:strand:- start:2763 stop:3236 length:474 start_codon:yes stop_codon:yes gene_type:complete